MNNYQTAVYPCLVYYLKTNPDFGYNFTLSDIEKPSREVYEYVMCDFMTLGRELPTYEEWSQKQQEAEYQSKLWSARCEYTICKQAVISFEDIHNVKYLEGFVRFADGSLNEHFGVE